MKNKQIIAILFFFIMIGGIIYMADYNIQMGQRNADNTDWDNHYPVTKAENVITANGNVVSDLSAILNNIGDASPQGAYDTLTDLETAYPTGTSGIYVAVDENKWYYWNGTSWMPGGTYEYTKYHAIKQIVTFGDSITWYDGQTFYPTHLESGQTAVGYQSYMRGKFNCVVNNQGVGSRNMSEIWTEKINTFNFLGVDAVTITSGVNDQREGVAVGTITPIGSTFNTSTFTGALQASVEKILNFNNEIRIFLITPIKGWFYEYGTEDVPNTNPDAVGLLKEDYVNAMKEVGKLYSLHVCDLYNLSGINEITKSVYIGDNPATFTAYAVHPTNAGFERMGIVINNFLEDNWNWNDSITPETFITLTNIVTNGDFSNGTTGWVSTGLASFNVTNGEGVALANSLNDIVYQDENLIPNHIYYAKVAIKGTSTLLRLSLYNGTAFHSGSGNYEDLSVVTSGTVAATKFGFTDQRSSGWNTFYVDKAVIIDLTESFGAGNEPTKEEMDAIMAQFENKYFEGTVQI